MSGKSSKQTVVAHAGDGERRVAGEAHDRSEHVLAVRLGVRGQHGVEQDAELAAVGLLEERPVDRGGERPSPDVAEQDHALQLQRAEHPVELPERGVGSVHRDRGEALESVRVASDELRVAVVDHPRDLGLRLLVGEEDVGGRERDDLHVDAHPVHVRETFHGIGHRGLDAEEAGAPVLDDRPARGVLVEREFSRGVPDLLEVGLRVVVGVQVQLEGLRPWARSLGAGGHGGGGRPDGPYRLEKASSMHGCGRARDSGLRPLSP